MVLVQIRSMLRDYVCALVYYTVNIIPYLLVDLLSFLVSDLTEQAKQPSSATKPQLHMLIMRQC